MVFTVEVKLDSEEKLIVDSFGDQSVYLKKDTEDLFLENIDMNEEECEDLAEWRRQIVNYIKLLKLFKRLTREN